MQANQATAVWTFWALLVLGGGVALLTGHVPAGVLALGGGLGGIGWLGRGGGRGTSGQTKGTRGQAKGTRGQGPGARVRADRRHVPAPKRISRRDAGTRRKKAA